MTEGWEKWLLDMVGIATLSDMVPLVGENRVLAKFGLLVLQKTPRRGFQRLLKECRLDQKKLNEDDVGFSITPRINAASRMDKPELALQMLSTDNDVIADQTVRTLHKINDERKGIVASMVKEVKKYFDNLSELSEIIVRGNPNWQPSLAGLVCSKIAEEYHKPVFLWGRGDGTELKGSCRTWDGISVYELMQKLDSEFFIQYGGHEAAGGFVIRVEKVGEFEAALASHMNELHVKDHVYECDMKIAIDEITSELVSSIEKLAPYGTANPKPLFAIEGIVHGIKNFGSGQNHFEISFKKSNGEIIRAIAFYKTNESFRKITERERITIIGHIEKNFFGGRHTIQVKLVDVI
jgi:single-stranded-DNA-specific exonuclease